MLPWIEAHEDIFSAHTHTRAMMPVYLPTRWFVLALPGSDASGCEPASSHATLLNSAATKNTESTGFESRSYIGWTSAAKNWAQRCGLQTAFRHVGMLSTGSLNNCGSFSMEGKGALYLQCIGATGRSRSQGGSLSSDSY